MKEFYEIVAFKSRFFATRLFLKWKTGKGIGYLEIKQGSKMDDTLEILDSKSVAVPIMKAKTVAELTQKQYFSFQPAFKPMTRAQVTRARNLTWKPMSKNKHYWDNLLANQVITKIGWDEKGLANFTLSNGTKVFVPKDGERLSVRI